jgi:hypothetical protein
VALRQMVIHDIVAMTRNAYGWDHESRNCAVGHPIGGTIRAEPMIIPELFSNSRQWPCPPISCTGARGQSQISSAPDGSQMHRAISGVRESHLTGRVAGPSAGHADAPAMTFSLACRPLDRYAPSHEHYAQSPP